MNKTNNMEYGVYFLQIIFIDTLPQLLSMQSIGAISLLQSFAREDKKMLIHFYTYGFFSLYNTLKATPT